MLSIVVNAFFKYPYSNKVYDLFTSLSLYSKPSKSLETINVKFNYLKYNIYFIVMSLSFYILSSIALHDKLINVSPHMLVILTIIELTTIFTLYFILKKMILNLSMSYFHKLYWNKRFPHIKMSPVNMKLAVDSLKDSSNPNETQTIFIKKFSELGN